MTWRVSGPEKLAHRAWILKILLPCALPCRQNSTSEGLGSRGSRKPRLVADVWFELLSCGFKHFWERSLTCAVEVGMTWGEMFAQPFEILDGALFVTYPFNAQAVKS